MSPKTCSLRRLAKGVPGGPVVKNPPAGHMGSITHRSEQMPHAARQLNSRATATEARVPQTLRPETGDAAAVSSQHAAAREEHTFTAAADRPGAATKAHRSQRRISMLQKASEAATAAATSQVLTDTLHALLPRPFQIFLILFGLFLLMWQMPPLLKRITLSKQSTDRRGDSGPSGQGNSKVTGVQIIVQKDDHGLCAGTWLGLPSPHPKEGRLVYPGLIMGLLRVLAHETLRMDSEKRICLKGEALSGEAEHLGKKSAPFLVTFPKARLYFISTVFFVCLWPMKW